MGHTYSPESSLKYNLHILCLYFCGRKTFSYRNKTQPSFPLAFSHIKNQLWRISHSNSKTGYGTRGSGDAQEAFKNLLSFHISDYWSWRCTAEQLPEWGILNWIMWEMLCGAMKQPYGKATSSCPAYLSALCLTSVPNFQQRSRLLDWGFLVCFYIYSLFFLRDSTRGYLPLYYGPSFLWIFAQLPTFILQVHLHIHLFVFYKHL